MLVHQQDLKEEYNVGYKGSPKGSRSH